MKPSDFFLGVTELFSILLPGAAIAFIALFWGVRAHDYIPSDHLLASLLDLNSAAGWAAFLVLSYILGHVVASLGPNLDVLYDERKGSHRNQALRELADRRLGDFVQRVTPPDAQAARKVAPERRGWLAQVVVLLFRVFLWRAWTEELTSKASSTTEVPVNAYKLARVILSCRAPDLYAEVIRFEADSKFFRSISVVAMAGTVVSLMQLLVDCGQFLRHHEDWIRPAWGTIYLFFVFIVLRIAFTRFCELRLKATEAAFQGMLVVESVPDGERHDSHSPAAVND